MPQCHGNAGASSHRAGARRPGSAASRIGREGSVEAERRYSLGGLAFGAGVAASGRALGADGRRSASVLRNPRPRDSAQGWRRGGLLWAPLQGRFREEPMPVRLSGLGRSELIGLSGGPAPRRTSCFRPRPPQRIARRGRSSGWISPGPLTGGDAWRWTASPGARTTVLDPSEDLLLGGMVGPEQGCRTAPETSNRPRHRWRHLVSHRGQEPINGREIEAVAVTRDDFAPSIGQDQTATVLNVRLMPA